MKTPSVEGTYLEKIIAWHRERAVADPRRLSDLLEEASSAAPPRGFSRALRSDGVCVIAEIKRRSPSKGFLAEGADAAQLAGSYERGGASALSVLTDSEHFAGSPEDVTAVRRTCNLPILRKDFTVDPRDICDARIMGADAVLLIAAVLDEAELSESMSLARELGLDALIEVHDEAELETAIALGAGLIGVNQRNLRTFEVDSMRAARLAELIPRDVLAVAESGISSPKDVERLAEAGFDAVLVGELLVTSSDPARAVSKLVEAGRGKNSRRLSSGEIGYVREDLRHH